MEARRIGWRPGRDGSRLGHYIVLISILVLILARGSRRPESGYAVILLPLVRAPWFALSERNSPASIIVNMAGKRFMKESMPYVEACHHMYGGPWGQGPGPGENIPAWLVFDQRYRDRYIFAGLQPGQRIPYKWLESGVIVAADTLEELAAKAGLPVDVLRTTVKRFNGLRAMGNLIADSLRQLVPVRSCTACAPMASHAKRLSTQFWTAT